MTPQPHRLSMMIRRRREQYDKAQDVLRLRKLIQLHPGDPMLRKVGRSESASPSSLPLSHPFHRARAFALARTAV